MCSPAVTNFYPSADGRAGALAVLVRGVAPLDDGITLSMSLSAVRGVAADLVIESACGGAPGWPEDLLAVLGWDWARLIATREGWKTKLRLRRRQRGAFGPCRACAGTSGRASRADPRENGPRASHERWYAARWGVFFRRALPAC